LSGNRPDFPFSFACHYKKYQLKWCNITLVALLYRNADSSFSKCMDYTDFTATDFMSDASFRDWICTPDKANSLFWEEWCSRFPGQLAEIDLARQLLKAVQRTPHFLPQSRVESLWAAIETEAGMAFTRQPPGNSDKPNAWLARMTAIFLGFVVVGLGLALYRKS
jgi:hypothetical protein